LHDYFLFALATVMILALAVKLHCQFLLLSDIYDLWDIYCLLAYLFTNDKNSHQQ